MSGKAATKVAEDQFPMSPTASWFAGLFGQCCKGPPVEGELNFDDLDKEEKKAKKASKESRGSDVVKESDGLARSAVKTSSNTCRYMVDNSVLQIENRPGVAFRYSKREADKVRSELGPAKWGEIVEGTDEGDGWLKVGNFFLPMMYQGVPVVTLVTESESPPKAKVSEEMARAPATPLTNPDRKAPASDTNALKPESDATETKKGIEPSLPSPPKDVDSKPNGDLDASAPVMPPDSAADKDESAPTEDHETMDVKPTSIVRDLEVLGACNVPCSEDIASLEKDVDMADKSQDHSASDELAGCAVEGVQSGIIGSDKTGVDPKNCEGECGPIESFSEGDCTAISPEKEEKAGIVVLSPQQPVREWYAHPSVGTWLHVLPIAAESTPSIEADFMDHQIKQPRVEWNFLPSVGTWLQTPVRPHAVETAADVVGVCDAFQVTECEGECLGDMVEQGEQEPKRS